MRVFKTWLGFLYVLIFIQIFLGGATRLTESGLSITEWDVIMGSIPPTSEEEWDIEFQKYKESPQYEKINKGMTLQEFKYIYFWEYFHRLWGRFLGMVAILGMIYFQFRREISSVMKRRGWTIVVLIGVVGIFGWIMVASGLEDRPWVNAYKLSIHLLLAISTLTYILWTYLKSDNRVNRYRFDAMWLVYVTMMAILVQIFLGGVLSGMKAALFYPTWPDMQGVFLPDVLLHPENYNLENFSHYDAKDNLFMPAFIQFSHRMNAYLIFALIISLLIRAYRNVNRVSAFWVLFIVCLSQIILGVYTLLGSIGQVPVGLGIMHQLVGVILFQIVFYILVVYRGGLNLTLE